MAVVAFVPGGATVVAMAATPELEISELVMGKIGLSNEAPKRSEGYLTETEKPSVTAVVVTGPEL